MANGDQKYIDPSAMLTSEGRLAAARVNAVLEQNHTREHRLQQVVANCDFFDQNSLLQLAEKAIIWAVVSMARHNESTDCEVFFYGVIDVMYTDTEDAQTGLSASERNHICVAASALDNHLATSVLSFYREALRYFAATPKDALFRIVVTQLNSIRATFIVHGPRELIPQLIYICTCLCGAIDAHSKGCGSIDDIGIFLKQVFDICAAIERSVYARIDAKELVVRDGRIQTA